jgi:hypothetical protein
MKDNEHDEPKDPLWDMWDLLGKARAPKERPFFAAKVVQAVREDSQREPGGFLASVWLMIRRRWQVTVGVVGTATAAVAIALLSSPSVPTNHHPPVVANVTADPLGELVNAASTDSDYLGASLDNLLATKDNSIWLQADPSSLY